jgi:hypothetical protein
MDGVSCRKRQPIGFDMNSNRAITGKNPGRDPIERRAQSFRLCIASPRRIDG